VSFIFPEAPDAAMLIGYVRVSKSDGTQTLAPQRDAMLAAGVDPTRIYEDLASGRHDARPGLTACLKAIQPGNTLVLWKLDRLGRDLRHLVNTVEDLRTRGVGLKVLTGAGAQIDTTTANGRLAFGIFAGDRPEPGGGCVAEGSRKAAWCPIRR
jgi:DNA invertase Pin-like site-specific DNA recombinase